MSLLKGIGLCVMLNIYGPINAMDANDPKQEMAAFLDSICSEQAKIQCSPADLATQIQKAIELGTPIDGKTLTGDQTFIPLITAAQFLDPALVEWLLTRGASPTVSNTFFESPLHAVFRFSRNMPNCSERLSAQIAFYQERFPYTQEAIIIAQLQGNIPLLNAAKNNDPLLAQRCLEYGLNPNTQDERGRTALMLAAENKAYAVIRVLLEHGADVTITDKDARTAVDYTKRGINGSLKKQLTIAPAFKHTKTFLQYQRATDKSEEFSLNLSEHREQRDTNPPVPPQMVAAHKLQVPKPERPKRVPKRIPNIDSEEKPEIYYENKEEDFPEELISITGFNRPDLLFQPKKHKSKKKP